jgi:hypothetical protein
VLLQLVVV